MKLSNVSFNSNRLFQGDLTIWIILLVLCMVSLIEVYSASSTMSYKDGRYWAPIMQHGAFLFGGIFTAWLVHWIPCKFYKLFFLGGIFLSCILLVVVLFMGRTNGAARWIGIAGITIQPSEIAKVSLIGFAAFALATWRDKVTGKATMNAFKRLMWLTGAFCILIFPENFSTSGMLFCVILIMCFIGQVPGKPLICIFLSLALMAGFGYSFAKLVPSETIHSIAQAPGLHRVETWVNRLNKSNELPADPKDYNIQDNVQVTHARIAVATCGVIGRGPGQSVERDFLPQAFSDFIFAIIIEEGGIESAAIIMFLYLLLLYRAFRIADRCYNKFPAYLVMGLALMLVIQAMVNMAVACGAMPVTGQPLPLISKGGTSIFITCSYIGMMLSVSYTAKRLPETNNVELITESK